MKLNRLTGSTENKISDFNVGTVTPAGYDDVSSIVNWSNYGLSLVGLFPNFKDWLSLRNEIQTLVLAVTGADYANWNNLSAEEKLIAIMFLPTKIIDARGYPFFVTECGGQSEASGYIDAYQNASDTARQARYTKMAFTAYGYLGKNQGLKAENYLRVDSLDALYLERGVCEKAIDGIAGISDWLLSTAGSGYETTGLKARIDNGEFVLPAGLTSAAFCGLLDGIVQNGIY